MDLRSILVPVDFSDASRDALSQAAGLARAVDGSLTLLHVVDLPPAGWVGFEALDVDLRAPQVELLARTRDHLREEAEKVPATRGLEVTVRARDGSPGREIVSELREADMDLVVMATHGRSGLTHLLLGSVAEKVLRAAPCPVLTVRPGQEFRRPEVVLHPSDLSEESLAALEPATWLAQRFGAELVLFHALEEPHLSVGTFQEVFRITPEELQGRLEDRVRTAFAERLESRVPEGVPVRTVLAGGRPHEAIAAEAATGATLIVMGTHGRGGWQEAVLGSVAERVVRSAPCPVLTIRPDSAD